MPSWPPPFLHHPTSWCGRVLASVLEFFASKILPFFQELGTKFSLICRRNNLMILCSRSGSSSSTERARRWVAFAGGCGQLPSSGRSGGCWRTASATSGRRTGPPPSTPGGPRSCCEASWRTSRCSSAASRCSSAPAATGSRPLSSRTCLAGGSASTLWSSGRTPQVSAC